MKGKLILIGAMAIIALGVFAYTRQGKAETSAVAAEDTKAQEIAKDEAKLASIEDRDSQEYKDAKAQFCALRSRPATEREQAVANVREFLGKPDVEVTFDCGRGNYEYYTAARQSFIVDPQTNYIIEVGEAERRWGTNEDGTRWFDPMPEYDYTPRYTAEEARQVAEKFLTDHKDIFGIDISRMTGKYEGMKDGGGELVNYFFNWRTTDENGKTTELVNVTITRGGQVIVYDNDTYDLAKN